MSLDFLPSYYEQIYEENHKLKLINRELEQENQKQKLEIHRLCDMLLADLFEFHQMKIRAKNAHGEIIGDTLKISDK